MRAAVRCWLANQAMGLAACALIPTADLAWPGSLSSHPAAIGTGAGNPDFRLRRMEEDGEEEQAPEVAAEQQMPDAAPEAPASGLVPDKR